MKVSFRRPLPDSPQHISAAAANIDNRYRLFGPDASHHALKPSQCWAVGQGKAIDHSQSTQAVMEFREANRFRVHQLRAGAALAEIIHQLSVPCGLKQHAFGCEAGTKSHGASPPGKSTGLQHLS